MLEELDLRGELQREVMDALWRLQGGSVEEVREALPAARSAAYTTVQTVLNRLAERGLVRRDREGRAIRYSAKISEAEYFAGSLRRALGGASRGARRTAIANLVEELPRDELEEIRQVAAEAGRRRSR
jgi:predicted transcriptional regulator